MGDIWSNARIDGFDTIAEYIDPIDTECPEESCKDISWISQHITQSQYLLQIVKCGNDECCSPFRSKMLPNMLTKGKFNFQLPIPIAIDSKTDFRIVVNDKEKIKINEFLPLLLCRNIQPESHVYDFACPSIQSKIIGRTCECGQYFSSIKILKEHMKLHKNKNTRTRAQTLTKPSKIITRRMDNNGSFEVLAVVNNDHDSRDIEWLPEEDVLSDENIANIADTENSEMPIFGEIENPWQDDFNLT